MHKWFWITWERQRRSIELSNRLGCRLFVFEHTGVLRYPKSVMQTVWVLLRYRPEILFVQNPSMILASVACFWGQIARVPVIVDRHTTFRLDRKPGFKPGELLFGMLDNYTLRVADLTIVTNKRLAEIVRKKKGRPFVLPDPLPRLDGRSRSLPHEFNIFMICSYGKDEPVDKAILAMKDICGDYGPEKVHLYISGNDKKLNGKVKAKAPENITFTGFLSDREFVDMLFSAEAVMTLTTASACMLCGCYEAIAAGKPLITSDKDVLKEYFAGGIFVDNSRRGIHGGILEVVEKLPSYAYTTMQLKRKIEKQWPKQLNHLVRELESIEKPRQPIKRGRL